MPEQRPSLSLVTTGLIVLSPILPLTSTLQRHILDLSAHHRRLSFEVLRICPPVIRSVGKAKRAQERNSLIQRNHLPPVLLSYAILSLWGLGSLGIVLEAYSYIITLLIQSLLFPTPHIWSIFLRNNSCRTAWRLVIRHIWEER
jgi:hypothetical protein